MERSISNRFYFDYNATSPLSIKVIDFLRSGDFLFGNPASLHTTGKKSKKYISETTKYLHSTFGLSEDKFHLIYHSGATEGINSFFKGNAIEDFSKNKKSLFVFSKVDHSAVISLEEDLKKLNHDVYLFDVDVNGNFNSDELVNYINSQKQKYHQIYLNYTYVNNESGIIWPLNTASLIKQKTGAIIHVDAVQLVGKVESWNQLNLDLDAYVFSSHKFGSLKGIGFTFLNKNSPYKTLLTGGSQQSGLRSGTENALSVYTIKLALEDLKENFNPTELKLAKSKIENEIAEVLNSKGQVIGRSNPNRNLNTIFFVIPGTKAELISMKFDMQGMDVSTGSACSSGVIKENRVLMEMGHSVENARASIRLSFSPFLNQTESDLFSQKIISVIKSFI